MSKTARAERVQQGCHSHVQLRSGRTSSSSMHQWYDQLERHIWRRCLQAQGATVPFRLQQNSKAKAGRPCSSRGASTTIRQGLPCSCQYAEAVCRPHHCRPALSAFAQERCAAAGMDYDEVVSQAVVWQGAVPAADDAANDDAVKQDADTKVAAGTPSFAPVELTQPHPVRSMLTARFSMVSTCR